MDEYWTAVLVNEETERVRKRSEASHDEDHENIHNKRDSDLEENIDDKSPVQTLRRKRQQQSKSIIYRNVSMNKRFTLIMVKS